MYLVSKGLWKAVNDGLIVWVDCVSGYEAEGPPELEIQEWRVLNVQSTLLDQTSRYNCMVGAPNKYPQISVCVSRFTFCPKLLAELLL